MTAADGRKRFRRIATADPLRSALDALRHAN